MKESIALLSLVAFVLAAGPSTTEAQVFDHLKCYKIKDEARFEVNVDLTALQTEFGMESCVVKGKGKMFCVPVDKLASNFVDKTKVGIPQVALQGVTPVDDRICYKMKCPKVEIDPLQVTDQFGTRNVGRFKPAMLCAPAMKGVPGAEFDIVFQLDTDVTLGALQFAVDYAGAPGEFAGEGTLVDCTNLTIPFSSFADIDASSELRAAWISFGPGLVGPNLPIVTCTFSTVGFTATQEPEIADFGITVVDAALLNQTPTTATVSIVSITPVP